MLSAGLVVGFLIGLFKGILCLHVNEYIRHGMYTISLFVFQWIVTEWSMWVPLWVISSCFGVIALYFLVKMKVKTARESAVITVALILSSALFLIGAYLNYRVLLFGFFTATGIIYSAIVCILAILLMVLLKSLLLRVDCGWVKGMYSRCSWIEKWARRTALGTVALLLILNIGGLSYKRQNVPSGPNVLLIVVDTLRSDHVGCSGYTRNTSPNIDQLAKEGLFFKRCASQAPWTLPSVATMLTSLYPSVHGAKDSSRKLGSRLITLPEILMDHFYETGAVISGDFVSSHYGFNQGFGFFDEKSICGHRGISSPSVSKKAITFLRGKKGRKFFLFLHYFDPHFNFVRHEGYRYFGNYTGPLYGGQDIGELRKMRRTLSHDDIEYLKALYDGEISFTDEYIGLVIKELKRLGLYDNTVVIFTADHGEEFMERGWLGHSTTLYPEQIHVPLIVKLPGKKTRRTVENPVGPIDIMPTVLGICGLENNGNIYMQGVNLQDLAERMGTADERAIFSEVSYIDGAIRSFKQSAILGGWKITRNVKDNTYELHNVEADQDERKNVAGEHKEIAEGMKDLLDEWEKGNRTISDDDGLHDTITMQEELKSRLRSLGYIN